MIWRYENLMIWKFGNLEKIDPVLESHKKIATNTLIHQRPQKKEYQKASYVKIRDFVV